MATIARLMLQNGVTSFSRILETNDSAPDVSAKGGGSQRTFASVFAISDPTARALPDEEAQFHSAEGRLKTLIQRQ
jgi:hypothetical protein